jgi:hypothetical protein
MANQEAGPVNGPRHDHVLPARRESGRQGAKPQRRSPLGRYWLVIAAALACTAMLGRGARPAEISQVAQTPSAYADAARALMGVWRGSYICRQGETGVELNFTELRPDGAVSGTFSFFNMPGQHNAAEGAFALSGQYDLASGKLTMISGAWIKQPANYVTTGFIAYYRPPSRAFAGTMDNNACGQITVTKSGD